MPLEAHALAQIGAALFPEGVQVLAEGELRQPLGSSSHVLLKDSHVSLLLHAEMTPSFPRGGPVLHIEPVAFWDVTFRAFGTYYFGAFSSIIPLEDPATTKTPGDRQAGAGLRLDAETRLKAKVGPIIAVVEAGVRHHQVWSELEWFWEPSEMLTIPREGLVIRRSAILLLEPREEPPVRIGFLGNWDSCPATDDENVRLGPLLMWKPTPKTPTLYAGTQAWLVSRFADPFPPYVFLAAAWEA